MASETRASILLFPPGWLSSGGREKEKVSGALETRGRDHNHNGSVVYTCRLRECLGRRFLLSFACLKVFSGFLRH